MLSSHTLEQGSINTKNDSRRWRRKDATSTTTFDNRFNSIQLFSPNTFPYQLLVYHKKAPL